MKNDFLLNTNRAAALYEAVKDLPLIDWHNHLSVADLAEDRHFSSLAELWLKSDPYKHRAMRICGVAERFITGDASDHEKFLAWSETVPKLIGNPLYHWACLELERVFNIREELNPASAERIWKDAGEKLASPEFSARMLLKHFRVEYAAPCVSLADRLSGFPALDGLVPSFRGDDLAACNLELIRKLEASAGKKINTLAALREVVAERLDALHERGCRFSDHALDGGFSYHPEDGKNDMRFLAYLRSGHLEETEKQKLECALLRLLASEYARRGWTLQLHIGAQRQTSSRLRKLVGPAGGYAGIAQACDIHSLTSMLDDFEVDANGLPRIILYTLNPADNAALAVLSGSYSEDGAAGKVQLGPAWWFCDHIYGMRECFEDIAAYGVLSTFIGMTTDSRSLLSFVRHEYFRRVFCAWVGEKAGRGEFPDDFGKLKEMACAVCYENAKKLIEGIK